MNTVPPNHIVWNWESQAIRVGTDRLGVGPTVLLLPALSSISTRREMRLLQERLASSFATVAIDWPGFGDEPRPAIRWRPDAVVHMMARGHVYVDPSWLQGERLAQKLRVVRATGARHASIRFVTGMLDWMMSRLDFLDAAQRFEEPILVLYGAATPKRSMAEMQALATPPCSVALPSGKLGVHEEFPDEVAEAVTSFLDRRKAGRWEARCTDTAEGQRSDTKR
jgi:pimeloyl-ACP methyl ester carboxylesterase